MKARLKGFDSYLIKFISYELLLGEKFTHFSKVHFIFKNNWMRYCKQLLIIYNELYKSKKFNEKNLLTIEALLVLNLKKTFQNFRKNTKKMDFEIKELFPIFDPPYFALTQMYGVSIFELISNSWARKNTWKA